MTIMSALRPVSRPDRFAFWSQAEVIRLALVGTVALCPFLAVPRAPAEQRSAPSSVTQTGGLRAVKVVTFDITTVHPGSLGDLD